MRIEQDEGSAWLARLSGSAGAWLLGALLVFTPSARAQDAGTPEGAPDPAAAAPEGDAADSGLEAPPAAEAVDPDAEPVIPEIHTSEISAGVTRTRVALQEVRSALLPRRGIESMRRDLPRFAEDVRRLAAARSSDQIGHLSQRELADARHQWHEHEDQLAEWQETLTEREERLDTVHEELRANRRLWRELRRRAETAELRDGMREHITTSLEAIEHYGDLLDEEIDRTDELEDQVAELRLNVGEVTEQIEIATRGFRDRLFIRDSPSLWNGIASGEPQPSLLEQASASWAARAASATELLGRSQAPAAAGLGVFFVALVLLLAPLARRSQSWSEDDVVFARARAIVRTPLATAALLVLSIAPFVVLNAPMLFYDLALVLLMFPLLRVLSPLLTPSVRRLLYLVAVFLIVVRIESMTADGSTLRRVVLTLECVPACVVLGRLLRLESRADSSLRLRAVLALALVITLGALVADLFGWVFLAAMLMRGLVASAYAAFTLFAGMVVLETLLAAALKSAALGRLHAVRVHGDLVRRRTFGLIALIAAGLWVSASLDGFGMTRPFTDAAEELLGRSWEVGSASFSIGAVLLFFGILVVSASVARFVRFVLELDVLPRLALEPGVDGAISSLTRYVILSLGFLLGLASVGIDASQIALVAGALSVGVGFGLQSIVSNCISGVILMIERPVRLGDFIEVGPLVGRVERIGLRSSTVRALDGAEVIVPNDSLISREVVNWTLSDRRRRVRVKVGVAYGTDLKKARAVMDRVASAHATAIGGPSPEVLFDSFGESSLDFVLEFWTTDFAEWEHLRSAVGIDLYDALTEAGIEIPFPQRDLHVRTLPTAFTPPKS